MLGKKVARWSGPAAAIGSPLFVATFLSHSFWKVLDSVGLTNVPYIHPILAEIGLMLSIIGLLGIYRQMPASTRPANILTTAVAIFGTSAAMVSILDLAIPLPTSVATLASMGYIGFFVGFAGMGIIVAATGTLGRWRFVPLALLVSLMIAVFSVQGNPVESPTLLARSFLVVYAVCWLVLGVALWTAREKQAAPAVIAGS